MILSSFGQFFSSATVAGMPGGGLIIQSAPGRYVVWILAFLVIMPVARWCWRREIGGNIAPGAFIASFIIPLLIVPGIATESVRVTPSNLSIRTGYWFAPTRLNYSLSDLNEILETNERVVQRRVSRQDRFWIFHYRSKRYRRLNLPDLLDANRAPVIEYFRRQGISFRDTPEIRS